VKCLLKKYGVSTTLRFENANICIEGESIGVKVPTDSCFAFIPGCLIAERNLPALANVFTTASDRTLFHFNPVHTLTPYVFKIHINFALPSTTWSEQNSEPFVF
jgi:hypothetical protein